MSEAIFGPKPDGLASMMEDKVCGTPAYVDLSEWTGAKASHFQLSGPVSTTLMTSSHSRKILRSANANADPLLHLGDI